MEPDYYTDLLFVNSKTIILLTIYSYHLQCRWFVPGSFLWWFTGATAAETSCYKMVAWLAIAGCSYIAAAAAAIEAWLLQL
jgi:hypothetical protein